MKPFETREDALQPQESPFRQRDHVLTLSTPGMGWRNRVLDGSHVTRALQTADLCAPLSWTLTLGGLPPFALKFKETTADIP